MKKLLLAALVAAMPLAAFAADPVVNPAHLATDIKVLASDAFEGRGPATPGGDKAVAWIIGQMIAAGLEPGGDLKDGKRAWTGRAARPVRDEGSRDLELLRGRTADRPDPGRADRDPRQPDQRRQREHGQHPWYSRATASTHRRRKWNDFAGIDVKGRSPSVLINDPDFESARATSAARP